MKLAFALAILASTLPPATAQNLILPKYNAGMSQQQAIDADTLVVMNRSANTVALAGPGLKDSSAAIIFITLFFAPGHGLSMVSMITRVEEGSRDAEACAEVAAFVDKARSTYNNGYRHWAPKADQHEPIMGALYNGDLKAGFSYEFNPALDPEQFESVNVKEIADDRLYGHCEWDLAYKGWSKYRSSFTKDELSELGKSILK